MARPLKLGCAANPCSSCPYRKDTPAGVWSAEEYMKLPGWDDPHEYPGLFMCHHSTTSPQRRVCRGWLEVHSENIGVRLAQYVQIDLGGARNRRPTKIPLYESGAAACVAGLKGVKRPGLKARAMIDKLARARAIAARHTSTKEQ